MISFSTNLISLACSAAGRVPLTKVLCEWNQSVNCDFVPKQKTTLFLLRIELSSSFTKKKRKIIWQPLAHCSVIFLCSCWYD